MMNGVLKSRVFNRYDNLTPSVAHGTALFHSSAASERRRRTQWDFGFGAARDSNKRFNSYTNRFRRMEGKKTLLRNVAAFADHLFQSWRLGDEENDHSESRKGTSWAYGSAYGGKRTRQSTSGSQESPWGSYRRKKKGGFHFCFDEDEDVEFIFRSAFGGERYCYWSFNKGSNFHWREASRTTWNWRSRRESYSSDEDESDSTSERLALGLSASEPLKLEDVKSAYRACALRWHPDRHQGSSKVAAEEKFKHCSAAYKSLCDKLAPA
ncbi:hypothetical protein AMTRI_Chr09g13740 [Amborella trichopoda]